MLKDISKFIHGKIETKMDNQKQKIIKIKIIENQILKLQIRIQNKN